MFFKKVKGRRFFRRNPTPGRSWVFLSVQIPDKETNKQTRWLLAGPARHQGALLSH